jgi:RNA polymerase sigma-32 factor
MEPSLRRYVDRVQSMALLSREEEMTLARRWREQGDEAARNLLVQSHLRFVLPIARRYHRGGGSMSELVAEGNLGLLRAASKFEPKRGYRFVTYAKNWVRVHVSECAIRSSGSTFGHSRVLRKVRRELARSNTLVGEGPAAQRLLAERLQLSSKQVDALLGLTAQQHVSLECLAPDQSALGEGSLCAKDASPEQAIIEHDERCRLKDAVRHALANLDVRERQIVERRLMVDKETMLTLKQLGEAFGVSRERVRQLEARLKDKLATHFRALLKAADGPLLEVTR